MAGAKGAGVETTGAEGKAAWGAVKDGANAGLGETSAAGVSAAAVKQKAAMPDRTRLRGEAQCFRGNNTLTALRLLTLLGFQKLKETRVGVGVRGEVIDQQGRIDFGYFQDAVF